MTELNGNEMLFRSTKLGRIDDPAGLADALGPGDVAVVIDAAPVKPS